MSKASSLGGDYGSLAEQINKFIEDKDQKDLQIKVVEADSLTSDYWLPTAVMSHAIAIIFYQVTYCLMLP